MTKHLNVYTLRDNKYTNRKCTRHFSRFYCRLSEGGEAARACWAFSRRRGTPTSPPATSSSPSWSAPAHFHLWTSGRKKYRKKTFLGFFYSKQKNICFKSVLADLRIPWVLKRLRTKWGGKKNKTMGTVWWGSVTFPFKSVVKIENV